MIAFGNGPVVRASAVPTPAARIGELDALRGFALCGILVVNIYQQLVFLGSGRPAELPPVVALLFADRFLPIFAVLFGAGFGIFLRRAAAHTERPRLVLARRLLVLLVIGAVHFVFHPGEVLTAYAVFGLLVLLPVSYLRGRPALVVAVVLLLVGAQIVRGYGPIPGLLVLGYALAALGVPDALRRRPRRIAVAFAISGPLAALWTGLLLARAELPVVNVVGGLGGGVSLLPPVGAVVTALAYCCGFLLLLRTPAGPLLDRLLTPMGRMALTNYLCATAMFLAGGAVLGIDSVEDAPRILALTAGILVIQAAWSRAWLAAFRYGPAEWLWRCLTWWRRLPIRRAGGRRGGRP